VKEEKKEIKEEIKIKRLAKKRSQEKKTEQKNSIKSNTIKTKPINPNNDFFIFCIRY
jgi:hypothetical protein